MSNYVKSKTSIFDQIPTTPNVNFDVKQYDFYFGDKFHIGFFKKEITNEPLPYEPTYKALLKANGFIESNSGAGTHGVFTNEKYSTKLNNAIKVFNDLKKLNNVIKEHKPNKELQGNGTKESTSTNESTSTKESTTSTN